jgi:hypothetical protein
MKRSFLSLIPALHGFIFLVLFAACNSNDSTSAEKETEIKTSLTEVKSDQPGPPLLFGYLDTLFIESYKFIDKIYVKKQNKITFRFYITNPDSLTMHGWANDKDCSKFDPMPDFKLYNAGKSTSQIVNGTYLGNSVLYNKAIDAIIGKLNNNNHKFVVFVPRDPATNNGQIIYDIHKTNDI